jgi:cell division septation protein DedD
MQHTMVTFQLHRKGVVLLALGAVLLGTLLYMAGCLAGQRRGTVAASSLPSMPKRPSAPKLPPAPALKPPSVKAPAVPLAALGVPGVPRNPAVRAVPAMPETFALRAGTFADEAEAKPVVEELTGRGLQASVVPVKTSAGTVLHTVMIGRFASREEAAAAAAELERQEGISTVVVAARKAR